MHETNRTEISTLGEFQLIKHLTQHLTPTNPSTIRAAGDDSAVLHYNNNPHLLLTTDLLTEGIHFDLTYTPLKHLGYKAVAVNLSDIYAMNGTPQQIVAAIALSNKFCIEDIDELYDGIKLACKNYNVDLVGGDTNPSLTGLTIAITAIGTAEKNKITYRSGATPNDLICVSGNLGAAYMGLQLLEREKTVFLQQEAEQKQPLNLNTTPQPDFAGKEYLLERQLKPEPRRDIIQQLNQAHIQPTSMIDISDGLSSELLHICTQSHTGCRIYEERLPIHHQTSLMAEELNLNPVTAALNGGEDYELLFTAPLALHDTIKQLNDITIIGHITKPELGCTLVTQDHQELTLKAQGWNPLK